MKGSTRTRNPHVRHHTFLFVGPCEVSGQDRQRTWWRVNTQFCQLPQTHQAHRPALSSNLCTNHHELIEYAQYCRYNRHLGIWTSKRDNNTCEVCLTTTRHRCALFLLTYTFLRNPLFRPPVDTEAFYLVLTIHPFDACAYYYQTFSKSIVMTSSGSFGCLSSSFCSLHSLFRR